MQPLSTAHPNPASQTQGQTSAVSDENTSDEYDFLEAEIADCVNTLENDFRNFQSKLEARLGRQVQGGQAEVRRILWVTDAVRSGVEAIKRNLLEESVPRPNDILDPVVFSQPSENASDNRMLGDQEDGDLLSPSYQVSIAPSFLGASPRNGQVPQAITVLQTGIRAHISL
jgi:hypothetical protein